MNYCYVESPIGDLLIAGSERAVYSIWFPKDGKARPPEAGWVASTDGVLGDAVVQLREYFAGRRTTFELTLAPIGSAFQKAVWQRLREIPYGETISYGELARRVGNPKAARAVGAANGANPLPIVVPCHRVIGADGSLTGFAFGEDLKRRLLEHEGRARAIAA